MFKKTTLLLLLLVISFIGNSQTVIWTEAFQNACASGCPGNGYAGPNGAWSVAASGINGTDANLWYVSGAECGNAAAACGSVCGTADPSLHIGANPSVIGDQGAAYLAGGLGFWDPVTDSRAESPVINLSGQSTMTLAFNYIENGQAATDDASLWYFDGATWTLLSALAKTPLTCNPQGTWTAFSIALPASANNNPNVKIGFRWVNNDDNVGTDPSFAVDDIQITIPSAGSAPVANFTAASTSVCAGSCINFTNTSTFAAGATFAWDFGNGQISALQDPTNICYNNPGTFTVTLVVTDANGTDTETKTNYIVVNAPVSAGLDNSGTVCNNTTINVASLLSGAAAGGTWLETTGSPSGQFNTATGVLNAAGLTAGNYTFTYTVTGTAPCPNDQAVFTVTVNDCSTGPAAIINASNLTVCQGQSLIFNDASTGTNIDTWVWSFGGGFPGTANTAGPHSVVFSTVGTFNVQLTVTDDNGSDVELINIQVIACSTPTAAFAFSDNDPCEGDCITFTNNSTVIGTPTYAWTFTGGSPASSTSANPGQICYNTPGVYPVTLVVTNAFGSANYSQNVTVLASPTIVTAGDITIDLGESTEITATVSDGTISWVWTPSNQGNILVCGVPDCSQATVSPSITTTFTATTTNAEGCTSTDNVIVTVNVPIGGYAIGVPNSFSPNEDNKNDILYVNGIGITNSVFRIYNRYGQLVFESDDQNIGWDGKVNGEALNPATFAWTLEYLLVNGQGGKMNGNVTLLK